LTYPRDRIDPELNGELEERNGSNMSGKSYEPRELITLPILSSEDALVLGAKIVAACDRENGLPPALSKAGKKLKRTRRELAQAESDRTNVVPSDDALSMGKKTENAALTALYDFLKAWARVPHPEAKDRRETAQRLEATLFANGQRFARRRYDLAWGEAETRLKRIDDQGLEGQIRSLGGDLFLESCRTTHRASAELLGMGTTEVAADEASGPTIRAQLDAFLDSLREFVVQASAYALADANAKATAARLLKPLREWQAAPARVKATEEPAAPATPATPATPVTPPTP
jgi:hypothetical protein